MAIQQDASSSLLDDLYCEEEIQEESGVYSESDVNVNVNVPSSLFPFLLLEEDLFWEDAELASLFSKEQEQKTHLYCSEDSSLCLFRDEAVEWMLKVSAYYGFTSLTSILAINYLDRFLSSVRFQREKPWMIQLVAVTCLSLAAKVEETQVPLLLDLQVEERKYVFEAKTIQRMELLLLSTLKWKMHPVTPISFLDHITRRLGMKSHAHWDFFRRSEQLLLSVASDARFLGYLPSVLATATMMHIIDQVDPCNATEYQNQLLGVLKISEENVNECYDLILELQKTHFIDGKNPRKRKYAQVPCSPVGVVGVSFSCENSNDSWAVGSKVSVSSSPEPPLKKSRTQEKQMPLPSLNRVFVDIIGSPR